MNDLGGRAISLTSASRFGGAQGLAAARRTGSLEGLVPQDAPVQQHSSPEPL